MPAVAHDRPARGRGARLSLPRSRRLRSTTVVHPRRRGRRQRRLGRRQRRRRGRRRHRRRPGCRAEASRRILASPRRPRRPRWMLADVEPGDAPLALVTARSEPGRDAEPGLDTQRRCRQRAVRGRSRARTSATRGGRLVGRAAEGRPGRTAVHRRPPRLMRPSTSRDEARPRLRSLAGVPHVDACPPTPPTAGLRRRRWRCVSSVSLAATAADGDRGAVDDGIGAPRGRARSRGGVAAVPAGPRRAGDDLSFFRERRGRPWPQQVAVATRPGAPIGDDRRCGSRRHPAAFTRPRRPATARSRGSPHVRPLASAAERRITPRRFVGASSAATDSSARGRRRP